MALNNVSVALGGAFSNLCQKYTLSTSFFRALNTYEVRLQKRAKERWNNKKKKEKRRDRKKRG